MCMYTQTHMCVHRVKRKKESRVGTPDAGRSVYVVVLISLSHEVHRCKGALNARVSIRLPGHAS